MTRFALVPIGLALALVATGSGVFSMSRVLAGVPSDECRFAEIAMTGVGVASKMACPDTATASHGADRSAIRAETGLPVLQDAPRDAGSEVSMSNASAAEVAKAARAAAPKLRAGQWEVKTEIVSVDMPGAPAGVADTMKKRGATSLSQCFNDEQLNAMGNLGESCVFADFKMGNGAIRGTSTCKLPQGEMTSKMKGSYAADKFDYETETSSSMPGGQSIRMTMTITGRRTGGCTPDRKAKLPK